MAEDGRLQPDTLQKSNIKSLTAYGFSRLPIRFNTPQKVLDYLTAQYSYVLNRDTSQSLYQFFISKQGDCNEFSLLAGHLLKRQGLEVEILHLKPSIWGRHVAVIYKQGDGYYLMDASRAAILRVLAQREEREPLQPVDLQVRDLIQGFDRIHGPVRNKEDLVGLYNGRPAGRHGLPAGKFCKIPTGGRWLSGRRNPSFSDDLDNKNPGYRKYPGFCSIITLPLPRVAISAL